MLRERFRLAAVPLDVRKGCPFLQGLSQLSEATPQTAA